MRIVGIIKNVLLRKTYIAIYLFMKRLYSLLVMVMLLTSSFVIVLNENFVKAANPSVFILRTCDGRTV